MEAFNSFPTVSAGSDQDVIKSRGSPPSLEKELWVEILSSRNWFHRARGSPYSTHRLWVPSKPDLVADWGELRSEVVARVLVLWSVDPSLTTPRMYSMEGQQRCHHHRCQHHHHHPRHSHHHGLIFPANCLVQLSGRRCSGKGIRAVTTHRTSFL